MIVFSLVGRRSTTIASLSFVTCGERVEKEALGKSIYACPTAQATPPLISSSALSPPYHLFPTRPTRSVLKQRATRSSARAILQARTQSTHQPSSSTAKMRSFIPTAQPAPLVLEGTTIQSLSTSRLTSGPRYIDACTDATKISLACAYVLSRMEPRHPSLQATELDPSYAKAWGRLAQANTVSEGPTLVASSSTTVAVDIDASCTATEHELP